MALSICFVGCGEYAKDVLEQIDAGKPGGPVVDGNASHSKARLDSSIERSVRRQ